MSRTFDELLEQLNAPLDMSRVKARKAPGMGTVPYLEGHDIISKANELFEYKWSFDLLSAEPNIVRWERPVTEWNSKTRKREVVRDGNGNIVMETVGLVSVFGSVEVELDGKAYRKSDLGRSSFVGDSPEVLDTALAGAVTDCMKRCFRQLGNQFGNSLYDKDVIEDVTGEVQPQAAPARQAAQRPANGSGNGNSKPAAAASAGAKNPAYEAVVPQGVPLAGKKLGEIMDDPTFGVYVIRFLAGDTANKAGIFYTPQTEEDKKVVEAAKIVLNDLKMKNKN